MAAAVQSPFATLLKRSKFSSFDPRIAQVYTTHGGDAHRGNWGFKRPLPIRRRGAYITVKAVDSLEQQTEWNSAEPQAMWMKNWDELQINPTTEELRRASNEDTDLVDSEYAPTRTDPISWRSSAVPNIQAMSNLEFKKYVAHIRRRREDFFKYQEMKAAALKKEREQKEKERQLEEAKAGVSKESSTSKALPKERKAPPEKLRTDYTLDDFAIWESEGVRERPRSRSLESVPHRSAGLHYPHFSALQTYLSTKEHKGRLVEDMKGEKGKAIYFVASYAGMGTIVLQKNKGVAKVMKWGDPSTTGVTKLRPESVSLEKAPEVVYKRQGLKAAKLSMKAFESDAQSHSQSNTHRPGSLEYITAEPLKSFANHTPHTRRPRYDGAVRRSTQSQLDGSSSATTLDFLQEILGKKDLGMNAKGDPEEGKS